MPTKDPHPAAERPTLGAQLARQHELLMAWATRPTHRGSQSLEWGERATGTNQGDLYFKSVQLVQGDEETDLQFLGRNMEFLRAARIERDRFNAEQEASRQAAAKSRPAPAEVTK